MSNLTTLHRATPEFLRFLLVGTVGFAVDAAILLLLIHIGGMSRLWARIPSFLAAVTVTWLLHRNFTFSNANQVAPSIREWLRFTLANAFGNGANLAIYALLVGLFAWEALPALAVASVAALGVNYGLSARWVFKRR
jgi:putative flippase GtrA